LKFRAFTGTGVAEPNATQTKEILQPMKITKPYLLGLTCGIALFAASSLSAADTKTYQVTGPVLELTPTTITVQKGEDKWELARNGSTKVKGDLKVGAKVTIYYTMTATDVEVKDTKGKKEEKKDSKKQN
jgi:hypothetical protein